MKSIKDTTKKTMGDLAKETKQDAAKGSSTSKTKDVTGQTHTSLKQMKARLKEVPKKSAATKHDKAAYEEE